MSRRMQENLVAIVILALFAGVIVLCLGYGPRARMVPLPLAVLGLILVVLQIIWQNLRRGDELTIDWLEVITGQKGKGAPAAKRDAVPDQQADGVTRKPPQREAAAYGIVLALLALMLLFGPFPAIFLFTGGYFLFSRHYSWRKGLVYTILFTAILYLLFVVALDLQLYHGVLQPLVDRYR